MTIEVLTWVQVAEGLAAPTCEPKTVSEAMDGLLTAHLDDLRERAKRGTTPAASFVSEEARTRFLALRDGDSSEFLEAASHLAAGLISRMDGRTDPGFLVALRELRENSVGCAVLKMEVTDPIAGFVRDDPEEGQILDAIRNLLDTPGRLQKGAVAPDTRPGSEVVVGDRLLDTALYFLDALGIRQLERPKQAVIEILSVAREAIPERRDEVAAVMQRSAATTVEEFVEEIPDLDDEAKADFVSRATQRRRPIQDIDTGRARTLKKILRASGVTISGLVDAVEGRVEVNQKTEGGWRITIDVEDEPIIEYK